MNDMRKLPPLDGRMAAAASFVRKNAKIADIGTDHGYLPISLLREGKISFAAAADIRKGPLDRAMANAEKFGVADKIQFFLTDGLQDIPLANLGITDIVICGMGGEGIARILSGNAYIKKENINLVLQPMTAIGELRTYLTQNGFNIIEERIASSNGKLYQCIAAQYDGASHTYTSAELLLGKKILLRGTKDPLFSPLLQKYIRKAQQEYAGKLRGGVDTKQIHNLLQELTKIAKEKGI